jgi:ribosomal-protein-alanine N-acetyltransferase
MTTADIPTKRLKLVPNTPADIRTQIEAMTPDDRAQVSPDWLARAYAATAPDPWTLGFAMVDRTAGTAIGTCAFKGPPDPDGVVEIAYGIANEHQGKGYATEAAEALVAFAFNSGRVRTVRAHTLAEINASTRVLGKCGFRSVGQVIDPEDGLVWRWERHRQTTEVIRD